MKTMVPCPRGSQCLAGVSQHIVGSDAYTQCLNSGTSTRSQSSGLSPSSDIISNDNPDYSEIKEIFSDYDFSNYVNVYGEDGRIVDFSSVASDIDDAFIEGRESEEYIVEVSLGNTGQGDFVDISNQNYIRNALSAGSEGLPEGWKIEDNGNLVIPIMDIVKEKHPEKLETLRTIIDSSDYDGIVLDETGYSDLEYEVLKKTASEFDIDDLVEEVVDSESDDFLDENPEASDMEIESWKKSRHNEYMEKLNTEVIYDSIEYLHQNEEIDFTEIDTDTMTSMLYPGDRFRVVNHALKKDY